MMSRLAVILTGISLVFVGLLYIKEGWDQVYGVPVPRATGVLGVILGLAFVLYAILRKRIPEEEKEHFVICRECKGTFNSSHAPDSHCPHCGGNVEEVDKFYERQREAGALPNDNGETGNTQGPK